MAITAEDQRVVESWLQSHKVSAACPSCQSTNRSFPGVYVLPMMHGPMMTPVQGGAMGMPVVVVACTDCHYMRFYSAGAMALPSVSVLLPPLP
jgi:hypothetical protein